MSGHSAIPLGGRFLLFAAIGATLALGLRSRMHAEPVTAPAAPVSNHTMHDVAAPDLAPTDEADEPVKKPAPAKPKNAEPEEDPPAPEPTGVLLELGNAECPVMGGRVDGKTHTDWNGLRVGHCCPGCEERFLKNPESLLDEVHPGWREAAEAARAIDQAAGAKQAELLAAAADTWKVLREPAEAFDLIVDVGNVDCPVMGGRVDGRTFTVWNHLRVGHCCPGCDKRFLEEPEELLDGVSDTWREAAAAIARVKESEGDARVEALAELKRKFKVVETRSDGE